MIDVPVADTVRHTPLSVGHRSWGRGFGSRRRPRGTRRGAGRCTYADDPRPACRTLAVCAPPSCSCGSDTCLPDQCPDAGPGWSVGSRWASQCAPSCPATAVTEGAPCSQLYAYCPLADATPCGCFASDGGTRWTCFNPPTEPQCPKIAPPLGTPCTQERLACGTYDVCVTGARVVCRGAVWVDNVGNCPN